MIDEFGQCSRVISYGASDGTADEREGRLRFQVRARGVLGGQPEEDGKTANPPWGEAPQEQRQVPVRVIGVPHEGQVSDRMILPGCAFPKGV